MPIFRAYGREISAGRTHGGTSTNLNYCYENVEHDGPIIGFGFSWYAHPSRRRHQPEHYERSRPHAVRDRECRTESEPVAVPVIVAGPNVVVEGGAPVTAPLSTTESVAEPPAVPDPAVPPADIA